LHLIYHLIAELTYQSLQIHQTTRSSKLTLESKFYSDSSALTVKISKWENYFRTWLCAKSGNWAFW